MSEYVNTNSKGSFLAYVFMTCAPRKETASVCMDFDATYPGNRNGTVKSVWYVATSARAGGRAKKSLTDV